MVTARKWDENGQPYAIPDRGRVKRPSDASVGKLTEGTATDWVTHGHLTNLFIGGFRRSEIPSGIPLVSPKKSLPPGLEEHWFQISRFQILRNPINFKAYGGSMYSRANVSDNASVATRKRDLLKRKSLPKLVGRGFLCGKVYSLACDYESRSLTDYRHYDEMLDRLVML